MPKKVESASSGAFGLTELLRWNDADVDRGISIGRPLAVSELRL